MVRFADRTFELWRFVVIQEAEKCSRDAFERPLYAPQLGIINRHS